MQSIVSCFRSFSVSSALSHVVFYCHIVNIHHDEGHGDSNDDDDDDHHAVHPKMFP